MTTIDERLDGLENSVNRMMELLQEKTTAEEAQGYSGQYDSEVQDLNNRMKRLERILDQLLLQVKLIKERRS